MEERRKIWLGAGLLLLLAAILTLVGVLLSLHPAPEEPFHESLGPWVKTACTKGACSRGWTKRPLIVMSLDGFRADYLARNRTMALRRLRECGVEVPFMYPSYPSKTFPNHYTIATGLYPESHGIIDNHMWDPRITPAQDRWFSLGANSSFNPQWWGGEPIWNTVRKAGLKSAVYFWPGSDVPIQGMHPNKFFKYDGKVPFNSRVDGVMKWLEDPSGPPDFLMLYVSEPDHHGHEFGPDSPQVTAELTVVDKVVDYLMSSLYKAGMANCVDLIILADHGMQKLIPPSNGGQIYVADFVNTKGMGVFPGPVGRVMIANSSLSRDKVFQAIVAKQKGKPFRVYERNNNVPARLHYQRNLRIGDVFLDSDEGYMIFDCKQCKSTYSIKGNHGYDYRNRQMHALFLAHGPSFRTAYTSLPAFENIELYNLFTTLLNIAPRPNNGTQGTLYEILVRPGKAYPLPALDTSSACNHSFYNNLSRCACSTSGSLSLVPLNQSWSWGVATSKALPACRLTYGSASSPKSLLWSRISQMPVLAEAKILPGSVPSSIAPACTFADPNQCGYYRQAVPILAAKGLSIQPILGFSNLTDALFLRAPMYTGFYNGNWAFLRSLAAGYATKYGPLRALAGPVFDYDSDGLADSAAQVMAKRDKDAQVPIPTGFFLILLKQPHNSTADVLSFLLPHRPKPFNVQSSSAYVKMHTARIRDIELLSGLEILGSFTDRRLATRLRTHINANLWP